MRLPSVRGLLHATSWTGIVVATALLVVGVRPADVAAAADVPVPVATPIQIPIVHVTPTPTPSVKPVFRTPVSTAPRLAVATTLPVALAPSPAQLTAAQAAAVHEVNYYPGSGGWTAMWTHWQPQVLDSDFAKISGLGGNAVRIIVFPDTFGWPRPSAVMAGRLHTAIGLAAAHGLRVHLTLFDWWQRYSDVTGSRTWATALLAPYAGSSHVALVELKNEVDLNNTSVLAWVRAMIPTLHAVMPHTPVTLSTSGQAGLAGLQQVASKTAVDLLDYHYYGGGDDAYADLAAARRIAGSRPLMIGEAGQSTTGSDRIALEAAQDKWFRSLYAAARLARVPAPAPWTLSDFTQGAIPPSGTADSAKEYGFGLYRTNGTAKPAVATVRAAFRALALSKALNNGFESVGSAGLPTLWSTFHSSQGTLRCDSHVSRSGGRSVSLSHTSGDNSGVPSFYTSPVSPILAGHVWTATAWVRGAAVTGTNQIALSWFDAHGNWLGQAQSSVAPTGTTGWHQLVVHGTAPRGAASLELHLKSSHNSGTVWFDDVTLVG